MRKREDLNIEQQNILAAIEQRDEALFNEIPAEDRRSILEKIAYFLDAQGLGWALARTP